MAIINNLKVVGTSLPVRQSRISMIVDGSPVFFKPEPGNAYDPLAIAVVNEKGHLGYIGKGDPQREQIRKALENGFVVARGNVVGGFRKRDGSYASYGLRVQWYSVDAAYRIHEFMKDEAEDDPVQRKRKNTAQKPKREGKEYKEILVKYKRHHKTRLSWHELEAIKERRSA